MEEEEREQEEEGKKVKEEEEEEEEKKEEDSAMDTFPYQLVPEWVQMHLHNLVKHLSKTVLHGDLFHVKLRKRRRRRRRH